MLSRPQTGFFDAGFSLVVLALSGLFIWTIDSNAEPSASRAQQQQVEQADDRLAEAHGSRPELD